MKTELIHRNPILKLSFEFSIAIIEFCETLEKEKKFVIARQLLKSGTSIGANCLEAQNAESKADFIHKFKIAAKEVEETKYWLLICSEAKSYPDPGVLLGKIEEMDKIISKIISSAKRNTKNA